MPGSEIQIRGICSSHAPASSPGFSQIVRPDMSLTTQSRPSPALLSAALQDPLTQSVGMKNVTVRGAQIGGRSEN